MPMPPRLTEVGERERPDHFHLPAEATCFFWGEYTRLRDTQGRLYDFSPTNRLIGNFKKKLERKGKLDWRYKASAIRDITHALAVLLKWGTLHERNVTVVPMPSSKSRSDPEFDDRMLQVCRGVADEVSLPIDIRDCLSFSGRYTASHESDDRPSPEELYADLSFDEQAGRAEDRPGIIFVIDDLLTTGAHFAAVARRLSDKFPDVPIVGVFVARRAIPDPFADLSIS